MNKNTLKSIWAVFAGFLTVVVLSIGTDFLLEKLGVFPSQTAGFFVTWMLLIALAYRIIYTFIGGYVTAYLAPTNAMKHVKILAIIGTCFGVLGVVVGWNLSSHWYPIAIAVTAFPCTWYGGKLRVKN